MISATLRFSLIRIGIFVAVLAPMLLLSFDPFFSTIIATAVAFSISLLAFSKLREEAAAEIFYKSRAGVKAGSDEAEEDAAATDPGSHLDNDQKN